MSKLIIIGCGPKAVAIAAKSFVLAKLGWQVPEIIIIDKHGVAANWDGTNGYTDGDTLLGTTPLEDVGFPYASIIDKSIDEEMLKLSFNAYMVDIDKYAEWVDRALPAPSHAMYASYFKWVMSKIDTDLHIGEVTKIASPDKQWVVAYHNDEGEHEVSGEGLVITGAGNPYEFPLHGGGEGQETRLFNGQTVWPNIAQFKDMKHAKIGVIGAGETSAGVAVALADMVDASSQIEIITRHPILFTRNENWHEVMYYSTVMDWANLSDEEKTEIIRHADRGTYSVAAKGRLDAAYNVRVQLGSVEYIELSGDKAEVALSHNGQQKKQKYDYVIQATGFDMYSFVSLFSDTAFLGDHSKLPTRIETDMSVKDVSPKLHLPMLAAYTQGPGFPNLSCLGLLSDRILQPYIKK